MTHSSRKCAGRGLSLSVVLVWATTVAGGASRTPLVLVCDGKPAATVVLAKEASSAAQFAAAELVYHVRKITGATLPAVTDTVEVTGTRILIGDSAATGALGLRGGDFKGQEYLIRFQADTLVLMGRDAPPAPGREGPVSRAGNVTWTEGKFGGALSFNGTDTAVSVDACDFSDAVGTVEAWVWLPKETQPRFNTVLRLDGQGPWTYHILSRAPKQTRIHYIAYDGKAGHAVTSRELTSGWHHAMATYSAAEGKLELFVDGVSQGTTRYKKTTCRGSRLHIGGIARAMRTEVANPFRGLIDEVRISSVCRRPDASAWRGPCKPDKHTRLLLHLDEGRGLPRDASGVVRPVPQPLWCDDQGTSYAVHDFLERFCDVRWYGPTELQMVCPTKATLAVAPKDIRRAPALALRSGHPRMPMVVGKALWNHASMPEIRLFWARLKGGGEKYACNHSFYGYYGRFWEKDPAHPERHHPDWFAQGYERKPPQMCFSNKGFIEQVIRDARDYFDDKGTKPGSRAVGDYFALVPMDNGQWCKCAACQAQMDKAEEDNAQFNNGLASDYVFGFVNKVARALRQSHPNKHLSAIAYHDYAYYPRRVRLEPNVSVQMCLTVRHWWAPCMKENDLRMYRAWVSREKGRRPLYLWLYYCFPELNARSRGFHCFPGFSAHTHAQQIKMFAADGIRGATTGGGRGEQVDMYITLKLMDDPSLDVDALLDEFFTRYYGSAAGPMKRVYLRIEAIYGNPANYPEKMQKTVGVWHQNEEIAWDYLGTEKRMAELGALMEQARQAARTPIEKQRVAVFDKGVWQYMVEGRRKYLAKKALAPEREKLKSQAPPQVRVPRAPSAGGDPAKVDWGKARVLDRWYTLDGYPVKRQVEARVLHDGTHLYLQLQERLDTKTLASAGDVWSGDDWELFFAPARARPYHQFGIAPNGKCNALAYGAKPWKGAARAESDTRGGKRWRVRVAFRLDRLIPGGVKPGARFYANFYRGSRTTALLAWSPNFNRSFHELSRLGEFVLE